MSYARTAAAPPFPTPFPPPFPFPPPPSHSPPPYPPHKLGDVLEPPLDNPRTDHITSHDAHIIDCRRAADPDAKPLPIAATLGIHLVKAEPMLSISQSSYFVDCIAETEKKWRIQAARRATLAEALRTCKIDLKGWALVKAAISATVAAPASKYVPHTATDAVLKSSTYKADHDDMVLLDSC